MSKHARSRLITIVIALAPLVLTTTPVGRALAQSDDAHVEAPVAPPDDTAPDDTAPDDTVPDDEAPIVVVAPAGDATNTVEVLESSPAEREIAVAPEPSAPAGSVAAEATSAAPAVHSPAVDSATVRATTEPGAPAASTSTSASEPAPTAQARAASRGRRSDEPAGILRLHLGAGLTFGGGSVTVPGEEAPVRFDIHEILRLFALDLAFRPFLGGAAYGISLRTDASLSQNTQILTAALSVEYDLLYLVYQTCRAPASLVLGAMLGLSLSFEQFSGEAAGTGAYILLAPGWSFFIEGRIHIDGPHYVLARLECTTGFDNVTHLRQCPLSVGYMWSF